MAEKDVQVLNEILARINGEEPTTPGGGKPSDKSEGTGADDTKYAVSKDNSVRTNIRRRYDNLPSLTKEQEMFYRVSDEEREEIQNRVSSWLSEENLEKARNLSREEIIKNFGNEMLPIAYVPAEFIPILGSNIKSNRVMSTEWYFVDHSINNHSSVNTSDYLNMQSVLDEPMHIRETVNNENGAKSFVFTKKMNTTKGNRWNATTIQLEVLDDGTIVWHKNYYNQKQEPNKNKKDLLDSYRKTPEEVGDLPSVESDSSIVLADESTNGRSLSARSGVSARKGTTSSATDQTNVTKNSLKRDEKKQNEFVDHRV